MQNYTSHNNNYKSPKHQEYIITTAEIVDLTMIIIVTKIDINIII